MMMIPSLFTQARMEILPRTQRYVATDHGVRQYHYLKENVDTSVPENRYLKDEAQNVVHTNLMSKMLTLTANKVAALDPYGMGVEMEGGKPGWYDALNGLPGLLGSSMAEAYEVYRMICWEKEAVQESGRDVALLEEVAELALAVAKACKDHVDEMEGDGQAYGFGRILTMPKKLSGQKQQNLFPERRLYGTANSSWRCWMLTPLL